MSRKKKRNKLPLFEVAYLTSIPIMAQALNVQEQTVRARRSRNPDLSKLIDKGVFCELNKITNEDLKVIASVKNGSR